MVMQLMTVTETLVGMGKLAFIGFVFKYQPKCRHSSLCSAPLNNVWQMRLWEWTLTCSDCNVILFFSAAPGHWAEEAVCRSDLYIQ